MWQNHSPAVPACVLSNIIAFCKEIHVQKNNADVEIGSYPFFRQGKLGVSIVLRYKNQDKIDLCSSLILEFVKAKNIKVVELE